MGLDAGDAAGKGRFSLILFSWPSQVHFLLDAFVQKMLTELWNMMLILLVLCLLFQGEVNCVKWDPTGTLLASCSDDSTAKVTRLLMIHNSAVNFYCSMPDPFMGFSFSVLYAYSFIIDCIS